MESNKTSLPNESDGCISARTPQEKRKKSEDLGKIRRTESAVSLSSSSLSTDVKDSKLSTKDHSDTCTSQTSDISPDPSPRASMNQALKSEKAFIEYVMSLPSEPTAKESPRLVKAEHPPSIKPRHKSSFIASNTTNTTKVGLNHLDNLCKLMEQLSDLRDTNTKLQKRVQYLEDLKTLHEMHKEIRQEIHYGSEDALIQSHLGLKKSFTSTDYVSTPRGSKDYAKCSPIQSKECFFKEQRMIKSVRSPSGRHSRALNNPPYEGHRRERSKSVGHEEGFDGKPKRIFPKWSKVKEAFGWESERKNSAKSKFYFRPGATATSAGEPFLSGNRRIFTENESAALRIPLYCDYSEKDEMGSIDTYAGEAMAAAAEVLPQFNSSAEDISVLFEAYPRNTSMKSKSLTIERDMDAEQAFAKFEKEESKKSHKSPWGRVKTIIERRRDSVKRRQMRRAPQTPVPQQENRYRDPQCMDDIDYELQYPCYEPRRKELDDQFVSHSNISSEMENIVKRKNIMQTEMKDVTKDKDRIRPLPAPISLPPSDNSENRISNFQDRELIRMSGSSPQLHRKSTWMKMKNVLRNKKDGDTNSVAASQSMPSSPNGIQDATFDFEDTEAIEDNPDDPENFETGHEITRIGSDSYVHKLSLSGVPPVTDIMLKLQRNISDDFNRKMQEWERIRNSGVRPVNSPKWERKNSASKPRKKSDKVKLERFEKSPKPKIKDLTWLEKELQKIEKEKQRLSKEKEKYEERAVRLELLRQTVLTARNTNKKEVLVRTSAGEFRFEGISDAFTKKLYEWETKRGLGPELSTIALLDSSLGDSAHNSLTIQQIDKCGSMQLALSRSQSSIAEIGQPSHTSSNSLPSLKPPDISDLERIHHPSRANSEPDLSTFAGISNSSSACHKTFAPKDDLTVDSSRESLGVDARESYTHPEVTRLIDSDVEKALGEIESRRREEREENYYSLLEENVILLEQLKTKEEICRRLETELELLDEKVDEMNKHHTKEMERYRGKLWEMHKPGSTPREVQGCLTVMAQLRSRIENLEDCSEKLKDEKETLEDSFRFHSAEQEHMTLDLLDKMRELHEAEADGRKAGKSSDFSRTSFDIKIVERLQDLSSQLVKQTQELEQALGERTRQICQLRWELLHRDVSTVKLETELHSVQMQGSPNRFVCDAKRSKYAHFRSLSSEEASSHSRQLQECEPQDAKRPKVTELPESYYKIPKHEFETSKLSTTVHELNRELIRLSTAAESFLGNERSKSNDEQKSQITQTENNSCPVKGCALPLLALDAQATEDASTAQNHRDDLKNSKISVRRNSAGNISIASGMEPADSESSSINNDVIKNISYSKSSPKLYCKAQQRTSLSDSDSSTEGEEDFTKVSFSSRSDRASGTLWDIGSEILLKQSAIKRKVHHDNRSEENVNIGSMNAQSGFALKKKNSYKLGKNCRKPYSRVAVDGVYIKQNSPTPSESDSLNSDNLYLNFNKSPQSKNNYDEDQNIVIAKSKHCSCGRTAQVSEQQTLKTKTQLKSETALKKSAQRKEPLNRTFKSHSVRSAASDSKIPKCNRTNIRKSESCHEEKKSINISDNCKEMLQPTKQIVDVNNVKESNFKRKNDNVGSKNLFTNHALYVNFNTEMSEMTPTSDSSSPSQNSKAKYNEHVPERDIETNVMPQLSVKRKLFAFQKQPCSKSECNEKELSDDSDEIQEKPNWSILKGKSEHLDMSVKDRNEMHETNFALKLAKRKAIETQSTDEFSNEQNNSHTNDKNEQNTNEDTVTVIIPKRRHSRVTIRNVSLGDRKGNKNVNVEAKHISESTPVYSIWNAELLKDNLDNVERNLPLLTNCINNLSAEKETPKHTPKDMNSFKNSKSDNGQSANFLNRELKDNSRTTENANIKSQIPQILSDKNKNEKCDSPEIQRYKPVKKHTQLSRSPPMTVNEIQSSTTNKSNYLKSPSAPQLDWKKGCAKKISNQRAPNVKTLIEKYNQKVLETQLSSPCSSSYNSPAIPRKISAPHEKTQDFYPKVTSFTSAPSTPKITTASTFYNPLSFQSTNVDLFPSPATSPPTSPISIARSRALLKVKEKFISSSSIVTVPITDVPDTESTQIERSMSKYSESDRSEMFSSSAKRSATDSEITWRQKMSAARKKSTPDEENTRRSICSNKSSDSMSLVLFKTGETCQESRLSKRSEKQKLTENPSKEFELGLKVSKSLSNSSIFKTVTGCELKLPSSFLRLKRSRKKKDMAATTELCRQSLLLCGEGSSFTAEDRVIAKSPRSCPSSPELKSKTKSKQSWFQKNLFKLR